LFNFGHNAADAANANAANVGSAADAANVWLGR